jgi:K+-sensing histidine kinase KdpD
MAEPHPDPAHERQPGRGALRIFFGACPGVGKTAAMLAAAQAQREQGVDVAIAVVETHGRAETAALVRGLSVIALRQVEHRGHSLPELDLDAVLARRPALVLVDELAHANAPGVRHAKRWQDVAALRDAGIAVWTTMNVQHLESLSDAVSGITGIRVRETVPDRVFDEAEEVVLVDLAPDALLQRLADGKVWLGEQAGRAAGSFFRKGNLLALRDLALRRAADRAGAGLPGGAASSAARGQAGGQTPSSRIAKGLASGLTPSPRGARHEGHFPAADSPATRIPWRASAFSALLCLAVTLACAPFAGVLELTNIVMLYLLAVLVAALQWGRGPAVLAAFLSVGAFDFVFVPPRFTFAVGDMRYLVTFAVMLVVALVIGQLTAGLTRHARLASAREDRVRALYEMSRELSAALLPEQIAAIGASVLQAEFGARAIFLLAGVDAEGRDRLPVPPEALAAGVDASVAEWAWTHGEEAGAGTATLPGSPLRYVPLKAPMRVRGVVALALPGPAALEGPEQRRLLETLASLLAIALERIHYVDVARETTVQMESERLRSALLGAISHDLRTPLAALAGMADSLQLTPPALVPAHAEIARALREGALRMNSLVNKLLDMARLQSGRVDLNLQWQPLEEVVGSALRGLSSLLDGQHPVKVSLPPALPLLRIDAVLIERVLANLIENAAKYTPAGSGIEIGASLLPESVEVRVDDEGPGLPRGRERLIFEKFERGRKESATPGVGLGLAICRAIVEAHGGTIRGETRPQGGARFAFTLPRGRPPEIPASEGEIEPDGQ